MPWIPPLAGALIALAALAAYSNSFGGQFVFDDPGSILENPSIRHLWPPWDALLPPHGQGWTVEGRPILNLSLAVNYAISGTEVWSYHALNLLIHICAGLAMFGIVRRTLTNSATTIAFATALLWTVHPLQTEAVTYVIQRAESLMGLFYLLTLYCFIRGSALDVGQVGASNVGQVGNPAYRSPRRERTVWYALSVFSCLLGMGTKEVMVTAPVMMLFYDRVFLSGTFREALRRRWRYYLALAATWLLLAGLIAGTGGNRSGSKGFGAGVSWWAWVLTQFEAIVHYLRLAIWPHPLIFSYGPFWISAAEAVPYAAVVALLGAASLWALASPAGPGKASAKNAFGFLGFWFFGILAVTSLIPGNNDMIAERRTYLPLAAILVALVAAIDFAFRSGGPRRRTAATLALCLACSAALGALTWRRNFNYRDELTIWSDTAAKRPLNPFAQYMVGVAFSDLGRTQDEIAQYRKALQIKPDLFEADHSLANALLGEGDAPGAIRLYKLVLAGEPHSAELRYDYGIALYRIGEVAEAIGQYEQALSLKPDYAQARESLGSALAKSGRLSEAIVQFREALSEDPEPARAHANLGGALASASRLPEAEAQYEEAIRLDPGFSAAHFYLGNVLSQEGRFSEAIPHYERALHPTEQHPAAHYDLADAHHNLGVALAQVGRDDEAGAQFEAEARLRAGQ